MSTRNNNPTNNRVYGGDTGLIHIADGMRRAMGRQLAQSLDTMMREAALNDGARTSQEINDQNLCPGCYMVALVNCAVELAKRNGQDIGELARSLGFAFEHLAYDGVDDERLEHIAVMLDPNQPDDDELSLHLGISEQALIFSGMETMGVAV